MNNSPEDIEYEIYKYKHNLEFIDVLEELLDETPLDCGSWSGDSLSDLSEYDSEYEEYQHFLVLDGDFWYHYI